MSLGRRLLFMLSADPGAASTDLNLDGWTPDNALTNWRDVVPHFDADIRGRRLLDYGCGLGYQAIALIRAGAERVMGLDINAAVLARAGELVRHHRLEHRITLARQLAPGDQGTFDVVLSQNAMEHYARPADALGAMCLSLKRNGKLLLTFGPPWLAPYGAHMHYFTAVPWVHLLFSERTVMDVRRRFRDDGLTSYEPAVNKMTIGRFERLLAASGLRVDYRQYDCVKKLNVLRVLPWMRELFINRVTIVARK